MRIWHQSFTDLSLMPLYRQTLETHAGRVAGPDTTVVIHGLRPGTYGNGLAPIDALRYPYLKSLTEDQLCEAVLAAEREGFDAVAIGCFLDPALRQARSLVDLPVVSLAETCMLVACSYGRKFAVITLCDDQSATVIDLCEQAGLERRLAGVVEMDPPLDEYALEGDDEADAEIEEAFRRACLRAFDSGAEVLIPGDGVLNEFLVRRRLTVASGATVMDSIGVLFAYAEMLVRLRETSGMTVSRRQLYLRPPPLMLQVAREFAGRSALDGNGFSRGTREND